MVIVRRSFEEGYAAGIVIKIPLRSPIPSCQALTKSLLPPSLKGKTFFSFGSLTILQKKLDNKGLLLELTSPRCCTSLTIGQYISGLAHIDCWSLHLILPLALCLILLSFSLFCFIFLLHNQLDHNPPSPKRGSKYWGITASYKAFPPPKAGRHSCAICPTTVLMATPLYPSSFLFV